jgi:hypothetical protein
MRDFLNIPITDKEVANKSSAINTKRFAIFSTTEKTSPKMKEWPSNSYELVPYDNLINPIRDILKKAYRFIRHAEIKF